MARITELEGLIQQHQARNEKLKQQLKEALEEADRARTELNNRQEELRGNQAKMNQLETVRTSNLALYMNLVTDRVFYCFWVQSNPQISEI